LGVFAISIPGDANPNPPEIEGAWYIDETFGVGEDAGTLQLQL